MEVFVKQIDPDVGFPARLSPHIDIPDGVKQAAASGFAQIRDGIGRLSTNTDAMMDAVDKSYSIALNDTAGLHGKILETLHANVTAFFDFAAELAAAKSPSDMMKASTAFAHRQFEAFAAQWKDFWSSGQRMIVATAKPVASGFSRGIDRMASS